MNGGWLLTATMRAGELCASTRVWAPVPHPRARVAKREADVGLTTLAATGLPVDNPVSDALPRLPELP